jgi:hypothetical protein
MTKRQTIGKFASRVIDRIQPINLHMVVPK